VSIISAMALVLGVGNHREMIDAFKIILLRMSFYIFFSPDSNGILFFFKKIKIERIGIKLHYFNFSL
jgi:hypothetical protein